MDLALLFLGILGAALILAGPTIYRDWKKSHKAKEKHA